MNSNSREKLLAGIAALSLLGISPQQTFAAKATSNLAVQQTKKIIGTVTDAMGPIIGATVKVKGTTKKHNTFLPFIHTILYYESLSLFFLRLQGAFHALLAMIMNQSLHR